MPTALTSLTRTLRGPLHRRAALKRLQAFHASQPSLEKTVDLAMHFGGAGWYRIKTLQRRGEILALARAVQALQPARILEIGTAHGGTLLIWAQLASERVITCDLEARPEPAALYPAFPPPGSACRITPLYGNTHTARFQQQVRGELAGALVDFLFIDGDHTEDGVEADYRDYAPLVRPGGIIAFHDIVSKQAIPTNQVHAFWQRLRSEAETEEFVEDPEQCGYGIGIVRT